MQELEDELAGEAEEDFLDPISCTLMRDPVRLPSSGAVTDRLVRTHI
jgi:ubiquitin conjugation factor E4 B